ncbi:unnamed protein product [Bursaphelenchus okinawaensis]|uniref:EB domain-containing protein n=1 Tax=Bursaphelenchus okinawaensis TaxID=465554 RepID=A0A811LMH0_9BILA|nr:unnamed protein product [Bursaphelenchus okinawaensis]CAG9127163.1 unnamed protein product [Bursaphelenchus okinawaensis]
MAVLPFTFTLFTTLLALSPDLVKDLTALSASLHLPLGSPCDFSSQCVADGHCSDGKCRASRCVINADCKLGEICREGKVHGKLTLACFGISDKRDDLDFCPGGGSPTRNSGGFIELCDENIPCMGRSICNPIYGVCCNKLRICPSPRQPFLEPESNKPVVCQRRQSIPTACPSTTECEISTGFCCELSERPYEEKEISQIRGLPKVNKPGPKEECEEGQKCSGGAVCECEDGECRCECVRSMGFALDKNTMTCKRTRRRLKEHCKFDMDCQSAFSECTSGGCRCKNGFQRDGQGGCKPTAYKCVNHAEPLTIDSNVITCEAYKEPLSREIEAIEFMDDVSERQAPKNCPSQYYCVPIFDIPRQADLFQGFCCPLPSPERPVCPVGHAHTSSQPPDYGCAQCPWDHYCHTDNVATKKKICCPKPCLSPEDVFIDGQCYPIAYHGDSCFMSEQCVGKVPALSGSSLNRAEFESAEMECSRNICQCPNGFLFVDGQCRRLQCTIGTKGEPILDSDGRILKCLSSRDCVQGSLCDPNIRVCCKGVNKCPKSYIETGQRCESDGLCNGNNDVCVRIKKGKRKICCRPDDCEGVFIAAILGPKLSWLVVNIVDDHTLSYGSAHVGYMKRQKPQEVKMQKINLDYALTGCVFDPTYFTIFTADTDVYMVVKCEDTYGLLRSKIYSADNFIFTPPRAMLFLQTANTIGIVGVPAGSPSQNAYIVQVLKHGGAYMKRDLYNINSYLNGPTALAKNVQCYNRMDNSTHFTYKKEKRTVFESINESNNSAFTPCADLAHSTEDLSVYACLNIEDEPGPPPANFKWIRTYADTGLNVPQNDDDSKYSKQDIENCGQQAKRRWNIIFWQLVFMIFEIFHIVFLVCVTYAIIFANKRSLSKQKKRKAKRDANKHSKRSSRPKKDESKEDTEDKEEKKKSPKKPESGQSSKKKKK